jgi:DNA-binding CsgD family transcriptional regulator
MGPVAGLVERDPELAAMSGALTDAASGSGRFVVVEGPAGIGKTSLLAQAGRHCGGTGGRVLSARGSELERQFSFGLVRQLFEPALARLGEDTRDGLFAGAAAPAGTLLGRPGAHGDEPAVGDFALLHGLYWLTANLCQDQALVLLLDDLHWADRGSLRFLAHLQPRLEGLRLAVVAATRPHEPGADQHLLDLLTLDPTCTVLRPGVLTPAGAATVLADALGTAPAGDVEPGFLAACHSATGGNPLLLRELATALAAEGLPATATTTAHAGRIHELAPKALAVRVGARLASLPAGCPALATAVAVLGEDTPLARAAALAGLPGEQAAAAAAQLAQIEILRGVESGGLPGDVAAGGTPLLEFVHPLVRAAVYRQTDPVRRAAQHAAAAHLLHADGADPERVAAHLLRLPPAGDVWVAQMLRLAAGVAVRRQAPEDAVTYLERCLHEPPPPEQRAEVLTELGGIALMVNVDTAARHLGAALDVVRDPARRGFLSQALGLALYLNGRSDESVEVHRTALDSLGDNHPDIRRRLQAGFIYVTTSDPAKHALGGELVERIRDEPTDAGLGSRMLDGLIAIYDAMVRMAPDAADRAWRCVEDGIVAEYPDSTVAFADACWVLAAADRPEVMSVLDGALVRASRRGSMTGLVTIKIFRCLAWLWRGSLAEAEADGRDALRSIDAAQLDLARLLAAAVLADTLMEQGRLHDAEAALRWVGPDERLPQLGLLCCLLDSRARLLLLQNRTEEGLNTVLDCGRRYSSQGYVNPAILAWRSTAALALHQLARTEESQALAAEELELARRWGAPRALGHALRVAGLVHGNEAGLPLLHEAVDVLENSPARLEYAKALVDLGAALRRTGRRNDAKHRLARGLDLAHHCGAAPLARHAETELRAAGARPRRGHLTGPGALTPSERRVADLAVQGQTNRDIAQQLFVTVKTVEVHLGSVYRKLGITKRNQLPALATAGSG